MMKDVDVARKYLTKYNNAKAGGHEFTISLTSFKNMMRAKRCAYTGVLLTEPTHKKALSTDRTIDRIDNRLGYVSGNVVACSAWINSLKSVLEDESSKLNLEQIEMFTRNFRSKMKKGVKK